METCFPEGLCLHGLFEAQVARTPNAAAIVCDGDVLTYDALNRRANRLARLLRARGVGAETIVGICLGRGVEMVIAVLGILKAGGAYLPLDPAYPPDRLRFTLQDAKVGLVVADAPSVAALSGADFETITFDEEASFPAPDGDPGYPATAAQLAYVIYTSGSTGNPKGVLVTHRHVTRLFAETWEQFRFDAEDAWTLFHSLAFDFSVWELWGPLLFGGRLVVVPYWVSRSPEEFCRLLVKERVTVLNQTPSAFRQLLPHLLSDAAQAMALRWVIFGGEALQPAALAGWYERFGSEDRRLVNMYGITETTVHVTQRPLRSTDLEAGRGSFIGEAIPDLQVHLLDARGMPVSPGCPGEICVSGAGVARGYLGRPELTAERFVPDPFGAQAGARMYRSGDLARRAPDGELEYLGRADHQVKIRGFRIELGEIESLLARHSGLREAAVVAREDIPGEPRLVAYLSADDPQPMVSELREHLRRALPEYMLPSAYVYLDRLPLTANGKVDRRALSAPAATTSETEYVAPRNPIEEGVAEIFTELLRPIGVHCVGAHDHFFDLGGHSLLAAQAVARVRSRFQVDLSMRVLFEAPTVAAYAACIAAADRAGHAAGPALVRQPGNGPRPLSFAQQRMWFLNQLAPGSSHYNVPLAFRLCGPLDPEALQSSLREIVLRHDALRTTFTCVDGVPAQVVHDQPGPELTLVDLQDLPDAGHKAWGAIREEQAHAFDLERGPLLRSRLLRLAPEEHWLLLNFHHSIFDGWSVPVLLRELWTLYNSPSELRQTALPPLPVQYSDFAAWQREWMQGRLLDEQLEYWRGQLAGAPTLLELPADRARPVVPSQRGAECRFELSGELTSELVALSRREGATLYMTLLAAFQLLLYRHTGQEEFLIGTPIANRARVETEGLIGFFANTLVIRSDFAENPSFRELLHRVRETTLGAYAHQDIPFERLVEELQPDRSLSHGPLFQVLFNLLSAGEAGVMPRGVSVEEIPGDSVTAKFDLSLTFAPNGDEGLNGVFEYSTDLFDEARIARMQAQLCRVLREVGADPEQQVSRVSLLSPTEHKGLVETSAGARVEFPRHGGVHELFETQAEKSPGAVAVELAGEALTYSELNARADRLASRLRRLGIGLESRVGLLAGRSLDLMVGLLAILKTGGACVPVDPNAPSKRAAGILQDAGIAVLLTDQQQVEMPEIPGIPVVYLGDSEDDPGEMPGAACPPAVAHPNNTAYVLYTSGSTGQPKGVAMSHGALANLIQWQGMDLPGTARTAQFAPLGFDVSFQEVFTTWSSGSTLVLVNEGIRRDPRELLRYLEEAGIERLFLPTAMLQPLAVALDEGGHAPRALRQVITAGEQLAITDEIRRMPAKLEGLALYNHYGPTETHVVTSYALSGDALAWPSLPPIGGPIANVQVYLLDSWLEQVPEGVSGEVYLGGAALAHGYLNRPELTAERFIPNPFGDASGERLYRTGDLARRRADGALEFLGRGDHQAKIRGYRVEPGEIETTLGRHPGVRYAVVTVREDRPGDKRLVAYVAAGDPAPSPGELRDYLDDVLPSYMVPSAFVVLDRLPLTPNGKVDRRALPAPVADLPDSAYTAPRNPIEEGLADIFAEVLRPSGVLRVSTSDSFFELGGHSLLAAQVLSRIRTTFQVELPMRALFESPTIVTLADRVADVARGSQERLPALRPLPADAPRLVSFAQLRMWFLDRLTPDSSHYNLPIAFRLSGALDLAALEESLQELTRRHEVLRTRFPLREAAPVLVIDEAGPPAMTVQDLQELPYEARQSEVDGILRTEMHRPFDLEQGPLFRAHLLQTASDEHCLLLNLHHSIFDGWSVPVLLRELWTLYNSPSELRHTALPPLPVQYSDFAVWQRAWMQGQALADQLAFWKRELAGAPTLLELPADRPRPPSASYRGAAQRLELPDDLVQELKAVSRREGVTLFMTLLAAFQVLLYRYSRQEEFLIGTPIANRTRVETEGLIGLFVNTLVVRSDVAGNPTFRELLRRVRERTLQAYAHQDLPFERLVEELQPDRSLSHAPLLQVLFNFLTTEPQEIEVRGLRATEIPLPTGTAKFDLTLTVNTGTECHWAELEYSTDLFDAERVTRMLEHWRVLLAGIAAEPERPISQLPLLAASERNRLLREWNDTAAAFPEDRCLHELFEAQVERSPDARAVDHGGATPTYRELNARANRLAHYLRRQGVGPEVRVAVHAQRSADMIVGLLGILKAGGVYVPLDPAYPPERLAFMLEDTQAAVVLTQRGLSFDIANSHFPVAYLDEAALVASEAETNLAATTVLENLAYIIYTSGSTGRPKGVALTHRSATALVHWAQTVYSSAELAGVLASTSICFDLSVFELFVPLSCGGTVILAENALALPSLPARDQVTLVNTVPSAMAALVRSGGIPASVSTVNLAGEPLTTDLVREIYAAGAHRVYDLYGPSEDTTYSTWTMRDPEGPATIGRPLANTKVYLLDRAGAPVPTGVPGELHLGGMGLARGYLNRPELTAERFVPNPFGDASGERLYRTGDLARYRSDGSIEFLGRLDHQVKIRGFRIELGEIESALGQHLGVLDSIVVARADSRGDQRLIAYLVLNGSGTTEAELREHLRGRLPAYMIPSVFLFLERMPLTPNGKVDRKALPAPLDAPPAETYAAPQGPLEEALAEIFGEVLGIATVGARDSFFELGGHSLLAVRLAAGVRDRLGRALPLSVLFQAPTVEALAALLQEEGWTPSWSPLVTIRSAGTGPSRPPLFLVHGGGGNVLCFRELAGYLGADQPLYGLQSPGLDGSGPEISTLEELAGRYADAVRGVQPLGPYYLGGLCVGGQLALEMARQLQAAGQEVRFLALFDSAGPGYPRFPSLPVRVLHQAANLLRQKPSDWPAYLATRVRGVGHLWRFRQRSRTIAEQAAQGEPIAPEFQDVHLALRHALARYRPDPYSGPITLFRARQQPVGCYPDRNCGWSSVALGGIEVRDVPGEHVSILKEPHVAEFALQLRAGLDAAREAE